MKKTCYPRVFTYSVRRNFHTSALKAAPTKGATINSQSCSMACPPSIRAGPMLRAGFTDVPVIGIHTMWISISVSPMASSARNACPIASDAKLLEPVAVSPPCAPVDTSSVRISEPIMAPTTWNSMYINARFVFMPPDSHTPSVMAGLMWQPEMFRCSFRRLLSINALQTDGSSAVSVWPLTRFRRWIRGGIVVQVFTWVWMILFRLLLSIFVLSMYPKSLFCFPCMKSFLLTLLWAKIAIFVGYLMGGWWIFVGYVRSYPRKSVGFRQKYPRKSVITYYNEKYFLHQPII